MNSYSQHYFSFHNYSTSKLPLNIEARYCFESELIKIPNTEAFLEIDPDVWVVFDVFNNIFNVLLVMFFPPSLYMSLYHFHCLLIQSTHLHY